MAVFAMFECWLCLRVVGRSGGEWADFDSISDRSDLSSPSSGISSKDILPRCEVSSNCSGVAIAVMSNQREEATANISAESVAQSQGRLFKGVVERVHWTLKLWTRTYRSDISKRADV